MNDEHKFFKLSQSVKALHKAYSKLGYELDRPINHLYLHNEQYINDILPTVNSFVNELKRDSTTRIAMADRLQRLELINELKDRLNTVGTIFVITHNQSLAPLFEQTLKIIKEKGVSKLEEK